MEITPTAPSFRQFSLPPATIETETPGIAGSLQEPIRLPLGDGAVQDAYHWSTPEGKSTFMYVTLRPEEATESHPDLGVARTNIDSEEIRGQGDALWDFMVNKLQSYSDEGPFDDGTPMPIVHHVQPNEYSRRLPAADPRYKELDDGTFVGLFMPQSRPID